MIGTPEEIVDQMKFWVDEGVADSFNLMPPSLPSSLKEFVDMIVPELQKRRLFRESYQSTKFRDHLGLLNIE